jgi:hypothetical protein
LAIFAGEYMRGILCCDRHWMAGPRKGSQQSEECRAGLRQPDSARSNSVQKTPSPSRCKESERFWPNVAMENFRGGSTGKIGRGGKGPVGSDPGGAI